jgi:aquaporin Z
MFRQSPLYSKSVQGLGTDGYGALSLIHLSAGGAFLAEVVLTALVVFIIFAVTGAAGNATTAGLVIGLTLKVVHLIGSPLTGTSVNPARSLGPALVIGGKALSQVWLFLIAPLVGGLVAAIVHAILYPKVRTDVLVVEVSNDGSRLQAIRR